MDMTAAVDGPLGTLNANSRLPQIPQRAQLSKKRSLRPASRSSRVSSRGSQTLHVPPAEESKPEAEPEPKQSKGKEVRLQDDEFDPTHGAKPYSPFYIHPMTETSKMQLHNEREALRAGTRSSESNDLESGGLRSHGKDSTSTRPSCDAERWGLIHKRRRKGWLANFQPRTRFVIKLALASIIICVMFGVGIVLTLAVSGKPWPKTGPAKTD